MASLASDRGVHVFEAHLFQIRQGKRIATTKPKVRLFWYGFELILCITKGGCDVCVRIGFMFIVSSIDRVISVSFIHPCRDVRWCKVLLQAHGFLRSTLSSTYRSISVHNAFVDMC